MADASTVPVIVYNVPGRTGVNIQPKTLAALAEHPNIAAIKEASGNMAQMVEMAALCGDKVDIYSGEDALTVPMMAMGAKGTISVLSNVVPRESVAMTDACMAGDYQTAAAWQCKLLPLINALFSEVNPIPAKAAASAMGFGEDVLRLPLTPMEEGTRAKLFEEMRKLGLNSASPGRARSAAPGSSPPARRCSAQAFPGRWGTSSQSSKRCMIISPGSGCKITSANWCLQISKHVALLP